MKETWLKTNYAERKWGFICWTLSSAQEVENKICWEGDLKNAEAREQIQIAEELIHVAAKSRLQGK